jgi:hypothetical protein
MGVKCNFLLVEDTPYKGLSNLGFESLNTTKEEMRRKSRLLLPFDYISPQWIDPKALQII